MKILQLQHLERLGSVSKESCLQIGYLLDCKAGNETFIPNQEEHSSFAYILPHCLIKALLQVNFQCRTIRSTYSQIAIVENPNLEIKEEQIKRIRDRINKMGEII